MRGCPDADRAWNHGADHGRLAGDRPGDGAGAGGARGAAWAAGPRQGGAGGGGSRACREPGRRSPDPRGRRLQARARPAGGRPLRQARPAGIDLLFANAGVLDYAPFADQDIEAAERMVQVNVLGTLYTVKAALPHMLARARGHIVVLSSAAGLRAFPWGAVYGGTKAFDKGFAEALRHELSGTGVSVTTVFPGEFATSILQHQRDRLPGLARQRQRAAGRGAGRRDAERRGGGSSGTCTRRRWSASLASTASPRASRTGCWRGSAAAPPPPARLEAPWGNKSWAGRFIPAYREESALSRGFWPRSLVPGGHPQPMQSGMSLGHSPNGSHRSPGRGTSLDRSERRDDRLVEPLAHAALGDGRIGEARQGLAKRPSSRSGPLATTKKRPTC